MCLRPSDPDTTREFQLQFPGERKLVSGRLQTGAPAVSCINSRAGSTDPCTRGGERGAGGRVKCPAAPLPRLPLNGCSMYSRTCDPGPRRRGFNMPCGSSTATAQGVIPEGNGRASGAVGINRLFGSLTGPRDKVTDIPGLPRRTRERHVHCGNTLAQNELFGWVGHLLRRTNCSAEVASTSGGHERLRSMPWVVHRM